MAGSSAGSTSAREAERLRRTRLGSTAPDEEALEGELRASSVRVRRLVAAVEAEEASLVASALQETAWGPPTSADERRAARQAESAQLRRLAAKFATARQRLQDERKGLRESLEDERTKLALALSHGVDDYYENSRTLRRERRAVEGAAAGGAGLRALQEQKAKLGGALRSLSAELEALEKDERKAVEARRELKSALFRREGALEPGREVEF